MSKASNRCRLILINHLVLVFPIPPAPHHRRQLTEEPPTLESGSQARVWGFTAAISWFRCGCEISACHFFSCPGRQRDRLSKRLGTGPMLFSCVSKIGCVTD